MCVCALNCTVLLSHGSRPSFARLPNLDGRSAAASRVGDCCATRVNDGNTLSNSDDAQRAADCAYNSSTILLQAPLQQRQSACKTQGFTKVHQIFIRRRGIIGLGGVNAHIHVAILQSVVKCQRTE